MRIAILDYANSNVDIIDDAPDMETSKEVEDYLANTLRYDPEEISFMFGNTNKTNKVSVTFLKAKDFEGND
jgi:hypothetical protein